MFKGFIHESFRIFFEGLEEKFNQEIVINLYPRQFKHNEAVIEIDQGSKNLYFLVKGKVVICSKDGANKYVELGENTYFGDYLIFFRLRSSNMFLAQGETEVLCIKKKKFLEICEMFPNSAKQLKYRAFLRRKFIRKTKKAVEEFYVSKNSQDEKDRKKNFLTDMLGGQQVSLNNKAIQEPGTLMLIQFWTAKKTWRKRSSTTQRA